MNGAITDGNGNVVGGGDLSLGADGTLDLKYNANGITNTFVSGATGFILPLAMVQQQLAVV